MHYLLLLIIWDIWEYIPSHTVIHLALDTGFGIGLPLDSIKTTAKTGVNIEGIMGHIPYLEDIPEHQAMREEIYNRFIDVALYMHDSWHIPEVHICNSASLFYLNGCLETTMIRVGIGLYGYIEKHDVRPYLRPVMYEMADVVSVKSVSRGQSVFYDNRAEETMTVAFVRAGYGDGYVGAPYAFHVESESYVKRVFDTTMNVVAFDIGNADVKVGDKVLLLGPYSRIRADYIANNIGLSTEKVLTKAGLSRREALPDDIRVLLQS